MILQKVWRGILALTSIQFCKPSFSTVTIVIKIPATITIYWMDLCQTQTEFWEIISLAQLYFLCQCLCSHSSVYGKVEMVSSFNYVCHYSLFWIHYLDYLDYLEFLGYLDYLYYLENPKKLSLTDRPAQLGELPCSEFDPELYPHSAYVKLFLTFATKVPHLTFCDKMWQFLI